MGEDLVGDRVRTPASRLRAIRNSGSDSLPIQRPLLEHRCLFAWIDWHRGGGNLRDVERADTMPACALTMHVKRFSHSVESQFRAVSDSALAHLLESYQRPDERATCNGGQLRNGPDNHGRGGTFGRTFAIAVPEI